MLDRLQNKDNALDETLQDETMNHSQDQNLSQGELPCR